MNELLLNKIVVLGDFSLLSIDHWFFGRKRKIYFNFIFNRAI